MWMRLQSQSALRHTPVVAIGRIPPLFRSFSWSSSFATSSLPLSSWCNLLFGKTVRDFSNIQAWRIMMGRTVLFLIWHLNQLDVFGDLNFIYLPQRWFSTVPSYHSTPVKLGPAPAFLRAFLVRWPPSVWRRCCLVVWTWWKICGCPFPSLGFFFYLVFMVPRPCFFFLGPGDFAWAKDSASRRSSCQSSQNLNHLLGSRRFLWFSVLNQHPNVGLWDSPGGFKAASQQYGEIAILRWHFVAWPTTSHPPKKGGETSVVSSPGITTLFSRLCLANYPLFFSGFLKVWLALVYSCPCCPLKKDQKITGSLLLHPAVLESRHRADQFRRRNPQLWGAPEDQETAGWRSAGVLLQATGTVQWSHCLGPWLNGLLMVSI